VSAPSRLELELEGRPYQIVVGAGLLEDLGAQVPLPLHARRALLVTQPPVVAHGYAARVGAALTSAGLEVRLHEVPDGEGAKSPDVLTALWAACADWPLGRDDLVVAVGGGVVGDLAGFVAATWMRGVALLQVPTTLLAMVDASIGGKAGINLVQGKNLVGAFHQPLAVAADPSVLATLPERLRIEGVAEVLKAGLLADGTLVERIERDPEGVRRGDADLLHSLVLRAAAIKARVVAADERESGERAHLNLGHTYGHVLETLAGYGTYLHGEAVSIGLVVALEVGVELGRTPRALVERVQACLHAVGLPTDVPTLDREAVHATMARDKKARDGVRMVLLEDIGRPVLVPVARAAIDAVLDRLQGPPASVA
jgi:3-dehydroquinate synthase